MSSMAALHTAYHPGPHLNSQAGWLLHPQKLCPAALRLTHRRRAPQNVKMPGHEG